MAVCINCSKRSRRISWSRHQKGSSGASEWPLRAQISKRSQKPNLHMFQGKTYCTKCLRTVKALAKPAVGVKSVEPSVAQA